jgi:hexosaminidase
MRLLINLLIVLLFSFKILAQQANIIPQPAEIKAEKGVFIIDKKILIAYDTKTGNAARYLADYLTSYYKIKCDLVSDIHKEKAILLISGSMDKEGSYKLDIDKMGISIAGDETGVFYGVQTLIQLLPVNNDKLKTINDKLQIQYINIKDYPRFAYRGMHLDVGRHFFPVSFIKKYIDYLALHKMNYFHWHLTEDQGWRIEIKKYPKLTQVGAWRNGTIIGRNPGMGNDNIKYGGFYTQEQIKDVVAYAQKRYITIIPEIEMPGHSSAAIAAYPELSCFPNESTKHRKESAWSGDTIGKQVQQTWGVFEDVFCPSEYTFNFLQDVLDEVMALFPSTYIHVGGDECPKESWKRSAFCQQLIKEKGLKDEHELQSYFIQRIEKYLNSKGRTLIGWDEILEGGLAPKAIVMSWRGEEGGIAAARQKHNVIMTPGAWVYFDHSQSQNEDSVTIGGYTSVEKTYSYEPIPDSLTKEQGKYVLGAQGNVWTEYMGNEKKVEYMIFPRMSALSEVLWSPKEKRNWNDFEKRLITQFKRYQLWKTNYSNAYFDLKISLLPTPDYKGLKLEIIPKDKNGTITYEAIGRHYPLTYKGPVLINDSRTINIDYYEKTKLVNTIKLNVHCNKATGKKITLINPPSEKYPGDGPFTLVNGVISEKGFARPSEYLGFQGTDCEAVIDLGKTQSISKVSVHSLRRENSQVWRPLTMEVFVSGDGTNFKSIGLTDDFVATENGPGTGSMTKEFDAVTTRFVKIKVAAWGEIPKANPGAGNKPWLFVDEIEVN